MEYDAAFFGLYENLFIVLKEEFGIKRALVLVSKLMAKTLKKAYDAERFSKGNEKDFARVAGKRDSSVGLKVKFPVVKKGTVIYRFFTDPFPNLRGKVSASELDTAYMRFKTSYLLGKGWKYRTTKHLWKGDRYTEHIITKRDSHG